VPRSTFHSPPREFGQQKFKNLDSCFLTLDSSPTPAKKSNPEPKCNNGMGFDIKVVNSTFDKLKKNENLVHCNRHNIIYSRFGRLLRRFQLQ
jgi:hypothetical protein